MQMTKQITDYVNEILTEDELRKMRDAIANGILLAYQDAIKNGNANMEVSQARGAHNTLAERLIADFNKLNSDKISKGQVEASDLMQSVLNIIDNKIAKGQVTMADLTQEVKEALTGGAVAVVGPNSTGTLNLIDKSVTEEKTTFMTTSTNLFNKNRVILNSNINDLGEIVATSGFAVSDLTKVPAGKIIVANVRHYALYDLSGKYIPDSKVSADYPYRSVVIDIPQTCYIRFSWAVANLPIEKQQLNIGEVLLPYEPYAILPIDYLGEQKLTKDNVDFYVPEYSWSTNLHADLSEVAGYYVNQENGTLLQNDKYSTYTRDVKPNTDYTFSSHNRTAFYEENGRFISAIFDNTIGEPKTITTPSNAKIMKYSISNNFKSGFQINEGSTLLPYETHGFEIKGLKTKPVELPTDEKLPDVNLPSAIYATVGEELKIFNSNILKDDESEFNINWVCDFGQITSDGFKFKPTTAGTYPLKFELYRKDKLIVTKDTTILSSNKRSTPIVYLEIGDSTTHAGANAYAITGIKTKLGNNLVTIGTQTDKTGTVKYEGRGGWKAETWRTNTDYYGASNPFYDPAKSDFDFGYYLTNTGQTKPDVVVINLGINDVFGIKDGLDLAIQTSINHLKYLVENIKAYDSTIKVAVNLPIPPNASQEAFASNPAVERFQTQWRAKYNNFELVKAMIKEFDGSVDLIPIYTVIDTVNNISDHVHPTETGYYQIADIKTNYLNSI